MRRLAAAVTAVVVAVSVWTLPAMLQPRPSSADGSCGAYAPRSPAGGVVRPVADQLELAAALKAARPGDVINLATGTYDEIHFRAGYGHRSGTATAPIVIQAAAGARPVVDRGAGSVSDRYAVTVMNLAHVTVRGLDIRHGVFGALASGASAVTFEHNTIHRVGLAGVVVNSFDTGAGLRPSQGVTVRCNRIHTTGLTEPEYGEGVYVGTGRTDVVDRTRGVLIEGNEIHNISNEAIDVKRHVTNVTIRANRIHDVTPHYGGAISLGLNKNRWGPANYLVEHNRIWNVRPGRHYAQAIAVAHGPATIRHNVIWNVTTSPSPSWPWTSEIQIHGDDNNADWAYGFGSRDANQVTIIGNTVVGCRQACIASHTDPGQIRPRITARDNIVTRPSVGLGSRPGDVVISIDDLGGPVTGAADAGSGPGSGLVRVPATTRPRATNRPPSPADAPAHALRPTPSVTTTAPKRIHSSPPPADRIRPTASSSRPTAVDRVATVDGARPSSSIPTATPSFLRPTADNAFMATLARFRPIPPTGDPTPRPASQRRLSDRSSHGPS